jgi:hypothetical protein
MCRTRGAGPRSFDHPLMPCSGTSITDEARFE